MEQHEVLTYFEKHESSKVREQMKHFGIATPKAFGVTAPIVRALAKKIGTDHTLALRLWKTGYHEERMLAVLIADRDRVTESLMDRWVNNFDSWAVCDICCGELFCYTPFAITKAHQWSYSKKEFVKRAGFVLFAELAVHDKELEDAPFVNFFPIIIRESEDERNFVRKAVNWSLRQIGKRNMRLHRKALAVAKKLSLQKNSTARWIGNDAIRDLTSDVVKRKFLHVGKKNDLKKLY